MAFEFDAVGRPVCPACSASIPVPAWLKFTPRIPDPEALADALITEHIERGRCPQEVLDLEWEWRIEGGSCRIGGTFTREMAADLRDYLTRTLDRRA